MKKTKLHLLLLISLILAVRISMYFSLCSATAAQLNSSCPVFTKEQITLVQGKTKQLELTNDAPTKDYTFQSKNPSVVAVDPTTGKVKAMGKGKTTILLLENKKIVSQCNITVENPSLNKTSASITPTQTVKLTLAGTTRKVSWKSLNEEIATVSQEGIVTAKAVGKTTITAKVGKTTFKCKLIVKKPKMIALTFDDGPGRYTPIVLDALEKHGAKATFFVIGKSINDTTSTYIKRAYDLGCEIGNHTYSHINLGNRDLDTIMNQLSKTDKRVKKITGEKTTLMRPPYGSISASAISKIDKSQIFWNVDTLDWKYRDTNRLISYVLNNASDGDIILMHDIHLTTANAVEAIVKGLQAKGFELVTVSELAAANNKPLSSSKKYYNF